jgi:hypothetical protein
MAIGFQKLHSLKKQLIMKKNNLNNKIQRQVTLEGMIVFSKLETELRTADFECCEDVEMEPFEGIFKVQGMRDGNLYMTEKPKRVRNQAIFRDDNSSLSLGRNGKYYFVFSMSEERVEEIPHELVRQAKGIAGKFIKLGVRS